MSLRTLVLTKIYPNRASYYDDWRDAFAASDLFAAETFNILQPGAARKLAKIVNDYEALVLLHACTADSLHAISSLTPVLLDRRGKLISFVGNEINSPDDPMENKIAFLKAAAADVIATQLLPEAGEWLYAGCPGRVISLPHALNPAVFRPSRPLSGRPIDIGVRNFQYLPYIGDRDRNRIIEFFAGHPFTPPLRADIRHDGRFGRDDWSQFLNRCRGTVSTEAGTFYLERDDATVKAIRQATAGSGIVLSGDSAARRLAAYLPYRVKSWLLQRLKRGFITYAAAADEAMDFDSVHQRFFAGRAKCPVHSKALSSRHFDAIGTKTAQIMFPGRFNDLLRPDEHYIALKEDFSNIDDVMERFHDTRHVQEMVDRAYEYALAGHTHAHRLQTLHRALDS